jgi:hypothetical protein
VCDPGRNINHSPVKSNHIWTQYSNWNLLNHPFVLINFWQITFCQFWRNTHEPPSSKFRFVACSSWLRGCKPPSEEGKTRVGLENFFFLHSHSFYGGLCGFRLCFFSSQAFPALLVPFLAKHKRSPELNDKHLGLVSSFFIFSKALERPTMVVCDVGVRSPCEPNGELLSRFRYARKVFQLISFFLFSNQLL